MNTSRFRRVWSALPRASVRTVLAPAVAGAVILGGCAKDAPQDQAVADGSDVVVLTGDQPVRPSPVEVSDACAGVLGEARKVMASHKFYAEVNLEEAATLHLALNNPDGICTAEEMEQFRTGEYGPWRAAIPDTMLVDRYTELSADCAKRMEEPRRKLRSLQPTELVTKLRAALDEANAALESCSPVERELFTEVELLPPQRRAGWIPPSSSGDAVEVPQVHTVSVQDRVSLSARCAAAVAPVRGLISDNKGRPVTDRLVDEVTSSLAAVASSCTPEELSRFQSEEVAPALGLFGP